MPRLSTLLLVVYTVSTVWANSTLLNDTICSTILNNERLQLRAVLLFPRRLYLITNTWKMYHFEYSAFQHILRDGLNLFNVVPVDMTLQWTAFKSNEDFSRRKNKIELIYCTFMRENEKGDNWVIMDIPNETGFLYDINRNRLTVRSVGKLTTANRVPITGDRFYTLDTINGSHLSLVNWTFQRLKEKFTFQEGLPRPLLYGKSTGKICLQPENGSVLLDYAPLNALDWPIKNGILLGEHFLLFTPYEIYQFSATILNGSESDVSTFELATFFLCLKGNTARLGNTNRVTSIVTSQQSEVPSKQMETWIIVLIIIIALVILISSGSIARLSSKKTQKGMILRNSNSHPEAAQSQVCPNAPVEAEESKETAQPQPGK